MEMGFENLSIPEQIAIKNSIQDAVENSVEDAIREMKAASGTTSVNVNVGGGVILNIDDDDDLDVIIAPFEDDLQRAVSESESKGNKVIVVDYGTDLGSDGVGDILQASLDIPLLDDDSDNDGISLADELWMGLNPYGEDVFSETPEIIIGGIDPTVKMQTLVTGEEPAFRIRSVVNDDVDLFLVDEEGKQAFIGETVTDEGHKGLIIPEDELDAGIYYAVARGKNGFGGIVKVEVDGLLDRPEIEMEKGDYRVLKGLAKPGKIVVVTWKSVIYSSIVLTDANGEFTVDIPAELEDGSHEAIVFTLEDDKDKRISFVSNMAQLFFSK